MSIEIGREAPDFELPNSEGSKTRLSDYRGKKNVLLVFYPLAFSPVCTTEFCTFRDINSDMNNDETDVLGISVDSVWALRAWKAAEQFTNTFLSDFWPHGAVSKAYDSFLEARGISLRGTFLIDKEGVLRWMEVNQPKEARDQAGWRKALAELSAEKA